MMLTQDEQIRLNWDMTPKHEKEAIRKAIEAHRVYPYKDKHLCFTEKGIYLMTEFRIDKPGFYETSNHQKAHVVFIRDRTDDSLYPAIGYLTELSESGASEAAAWTLEGQFSSEEKHDLDIIGEWHEPKTWEQDIWVVKYEEQNVAMFKGEPSKKYMQACKKIRVVLKEGEIEL